MGGLIELNDTLKLKRGNGFPPDVQLGGIYEFSIDGRRLYNLKPSRVFLVEEIEGKWNYIGHAQILSQSIDPVADKTTGRFEVTLLYPREYAQLVNRYEAPAGRGHQGQ